MEQEPASDRSAPNPHAAARATVQRDSGRRAPSYRFVEGLHLRQWLARATAPLAIACTNGAGIFAWDRLPRHDAPLACFSAPPEAETGVRVVGAVLIVLAAWLRIESKGVLVRRVTLTTGGVYAHVRHPFYLAVIVGSVGLLFLAGALGAVAAAAWLALAVPIYAATIAGEEAGLGTLFPDAWEAYARDVPRLFPIPGRHARPAIGGDTDGDVDGATVHVTWANLISEHEPPRLLRFLAIALVVVGFVLGDTAGLVLLVVASLVTAASRLFPGIRPPSRRRAAARRA